MEEIRYRPYKANGILGAIFLLFSLMLLFLAFIAERGSLALLGFSVPCAIMAYFLLKSFKTVVVFDTTGIRVYESTPLGKNHFSSWKSFSCACWTTTYKAKGYLVLTKGDCSTDNVRKAMWRTFVSMRVVFGEYMVMPLEITKEPIASLIISSVCTSKMVSHPLL